MKMQNAKCKMLNRISKKTYKHSSFSIHRSTFTKGFTLVELMIVVGIIAVLSVAGALSYSAILKRSRDSKRKADIEQIRSALEMYRSDMGFYPNTGNGGQTDVSNLPLVASGYMPSIPLDPFNAQTGFPYQYHATNGNGTNYYGYCLSAQIENISVPNPDTNCAAGDTAGDPYNYGRRNP